MIDGAEGAGGNPSKSIVDSRGATWAYELQAVCKEHPHYPVRDAMRQAARNVIKNLKPDE
jgi:hypothetical protein